MKIAILILALALSAFAQSNCPLSGPYECTGGSINGINFGDDADDDLFRYFYTIGDSRSDNSCTTLQEGTYVVDGATVSVEFEIDDDECVITGSDGAGCGCVDDMTLTVTSEDCFTISGPNGETCVATSTCDEGFTCSNGATPTEDPNYTADSNGCGPSAFPIAGPSFGFESCCEEHDICYGSCGTSRTQCDNDFYSCMYCICQDEGNFLDREFCEELACSYYELVDEFGCFSFNGGQEDACICPGAKDTEHKSYNAKSSAPSKFGPGALKQTELFCNGPFEPECPGASTTAPSPSRTPASGSTSSRTPSRTPASGSTSSRTPSRTPSRTRAADDNTSITVTDGTTITATNPLTSLSVTNPLSSLTVTNPLSSLTVTNPLSSLINVDDDDDNSSPVLMVSALVFAVLLLVL